MVQLYKPGDSVVCPWNTSNVYCVSHNGTIIASDDLAKLLAALAERGVHPALSPLALSHLLHHSVIPYPLALYEGMTALGQGDEAEIDTDGSLRVVVRRPIPLRLPPAPDVIESANPKRLRDLLVAAVVGRFVDGRGLLMLSSGKDSTALALALDAAGYNRRVECVTYQEGAHGEGEFAAATAARFGLRHRIVYECKDRAEVRTSMQAFFEASPSPSMDPITPGYVHSIRTVGLPPGAALIDGTGNDAYMGIIPPKRKWLADLLSFGRFDGLAPLNRVFSYHHRLAKLFRSRADQVVLDRFALRFEETSGFFQGSLRTLPYWNSLGRTASLAKSYYEFFHHFRSVYYDNAHTIRARETIAAAFNLHLMLPYQDNSLINYCLSLPESERFDVSTGRNKLPLRRMLYDELGYNAERVGKRIFNFSRRNFLAQNWAHVEEEIYECTLWDRCAIARFLDRMLPLVNSDDKCNYGIMQLYLVSGWHNHTRWLKR
ncbi:asparagine synthase-related protein [Rhodoplanes sp. SY1]|uniref:asparagine synthase-related protein n=1 Tax=Rhodoplanes sp. SY1 TaxID=3166646 RepID=UPI0038B423EC